MGDHVRHGEGLWGRYDDIHPWIFRDGDISGLRGNSQEIQVQRVGLIVILG